MQENPNPNSIPDDFKTTVVPIDLRAMLAPEKYARTERNNVIESFQPISGRGGANSTCRVYNGGRGTAYNDLRESFIRVDVSANNPVAEVSMEGSLQIRGPNNVSQNIDSLFFTLSFGEYVISPLNGTSYQFVSYNNLLIDIQTFFDKYFTGLTISLVQPSDGTQSFNWPGTTASNNRALWYQISGFSEADITQLGIEGLRLNFHYLDASSGMTILAGRSLVNRQGTLATPRLVFNSSSLIQQVYLQFGNQPPSVSTNPIISNISLLSEDTDSLDAWHSARALNEFGLTLDTTPKRIAIWMSGLPAINELIVPSFVRDAVEIHVQMATDAECLVRSNVNQTYNFENLTFNYYKLSVDPMIDEGLYNKALKNQLALQYHGWLSTSANYVAGSSSLNIPITFTYKNVEKVFCVLMRTSNYTDPTNVNRYNQFFRENVTQYRFSSQPGTYYPRDSIRIIGNSIADAKMEFLRALDLPIIKKKYSNALRSCALGLFNYNGVAEQWVQNLNRIVQPSFVMGINTDFNQQENHVADNLTIDNSASINGNAYFQIEVFNPIANGTAWVYLYYAGQFMIGPDMNVREFH